MSEIIESFTAEQAATVIPFLAAEKIDADELKEFLIANWNKLDYSVSNYATYFRKLAGIYDRIKWGWL